MKLSVFRTGIAENTGLNLSAETVSLGVIAIPNVQCIGGRITMADLYFRCGSKSEADSLVESAREFAEKHEMSIEHVIFDRQDGRTIMLNMYADSAVYREPTTLLVRNYACLGNSEIQRLTMHKKLVRNGLTVVFEGGSPIADERKLILHTIKSYYSCGDEWERKYAGESQSAQVRTEPFPGAKYAMPVPFGYRIKKTGGDTDMQKKQRIPKNIKEQRTKKAKGASAYDEALYFLTPKARTVREVENRLDECNYSEGEIMAAIDRLRNNGLLNDEKFARDFIESRLNTKPVSRGKLRRQLREHFVENAVIDEALSAVSDETELSNAAAVGSKYFRQYSNLPLKERLRRTGSRLVSCGYAFDDVKTVLSELAENSEETGNSDEIPDEIEFSLRSAENGADDEE